LGIDKIRDDQDQKFSLQTITKIIRVGLRGLIELSKDIEVVAEAENGTEVIDLVKKVKVDVVLMDIDMGHTSGIETTHQLKKEYPEINVLGLTMHEEQEYIVEMLEAGASGYPPQKYRNGRAADRPPRGCQRRQAISASRSPPRCWKPSRKKRLSPQ